MFFTPTALKMEINIIMANRKLKIGPAKRTIIL